MFNFLKKSVDSIIADIEVRIEQLHVVAEAHAEAVKVHQAEIEFRTRLVASAEAEYARAKTIANRFTDLIS